MYYVRNLPGWERILRIVVGVVSLAYILTHWELSYAIGIAFFAAMLSLSGLIGFCPMCAMIGRKLDNTES